MLRFFFSALFASLFSLLVGTQSAVAQDTVEWPGWRGPGRDAIAPAKGLLTNWEKEAPKLLWMKDGMGSGYSSVSIGHGFIFTTGNKKDGQHVVAAKQATGEVVWSIAITDKVPKHGYDGARTTPTIDGDRLYVVASSGKIVCLSAKDGKTVWSRDFSDWKGRMMSGWGFAESPLVDGDVVLCTPGGDDAMIVALNKMTGEEVWSSAAPKFGGQPGPVKEGAGYASIVISEAAGVKQYVTLVGRGLIGVRASDGEFLWGYGGVANKTANIPTPIVDGDYVFGSSGYQTGSALLKLSAKGDGVEAEEVYFLDPKQFQNHHGGMVKVGDYVYSGHAHNNGFPICLEFATGKIMWGGDKRGPGGGSAAVLFADGNLIFRYQTGEVALIEATPKAYNLKGVFTPEHQEGKTWAHPVIVDGKLYLREQDKLMCYELAPSA